MKHISKLDIIILIALGLIGGGLYVIIGAGAAMLSIGTLLLLLGFLVAVGSSLNGYF